MNRESTLVVYGLTVVATVLFYLVPLGILDLCIHLGWHS